MTFYHGLGMFIYNMGALLLGAIIAYKIINKVEKEKKRKENTKSIYKNYLARNGNKMTIRTKPYIVYTNPPAMTGYHIILLRKSIRVTLTHGRKYVINVNQKQT